MKARFVFAVLAAVAAAFAPAPFPRTERRPTDRISVETFQGDWRVASMMHSSSDGRHRPYTWHIGQIRVKGDKWTFVDRNGSESASYGLVIRNDHKPAWLDFYNGNAREGPAPGGGIIRRKGNAVEIIYVFGGQKRPVSFEQPPDGQYLLVLQR